MALILDTGPLFASLDRRDASHQVCRSLIETASEKLLIPLPILSEVDYFIGEYLGSAIRLALLNDIKAGAFEVVDLEPADYDRILELCSLYSDADIGFVDAAVFAIVERLREPKVVTLDRRHFGMLRPRHVSSLTLLP
jgi:predicted nucleic acid-binding protein